MAFKMKNPLKQGSYRSHGWVNPTRNYPTPDNAGLTEEQIAENKRKAIIKKSKKKIDYAKSQLTLKKNK